MQYQERQTQLANLRADAAIRYENAQREQAQVQIAQERELLRQEADLLYRAIPEWRDQQVAAREKAEIAQFLLSRGYSPQYVASIKAHREVLLARDAMRLARTQQSVAKNKVFKLGKKTLTPGSRTGRAEQNNETTRTLRGKLAKSGNMKDAAALISRLI
jgi:erythromycin esterase-like protein